MPLLRPSFLLYSRLSLQPRPSVSRITDTLISSSCRTFTTTTSPRANTNDSEKKSSLMDREAVNTESNEYSKTGSDDSAASQTDPAFQPGKTDPDSQRASSQPGDGRDPLNVSPANKEISQPMDQQESGAQGAPERKKASGEGSGMKNRKVG